MENLIEKLTEILQDFKKSDNITPEEYASLKNREFALFDKIETIKELCEYYKTDMELDKTPQPFISGFYSGVVNGSVFVMKAINDVLYQDQPDGWTAYDTIKEIKKKLATIQGLNVSDEDNNDKENI